MKYAPLGRSGLNVSRLCLGTMTFGNPLDEKQCADLVGHALDQGINFFDTADIYEGYSRTFGSSGGVAEVLLGKALGERRNEAVICTKFGNPVGLGPLDAGLSARHLEKQLEGSLRRLQTEYIDVVLAHRWDASVGIEEVLRGFERWVGSGKVRCAGVSNWPCWRIAQASEIAARNGWPPPLVSSPKYSLLRRGIEPEHVPCALHYGIAIVPYQPLEGGVLTGKYRRGQGMPEGSRGNEKPGWMPKLDESLHDRIEALERLAAACGRSVAGYVLSWVLSRPGVASVILGCRNRDQLEEAVKAAGQLFPPEHAVEVDQLFPPPAPVGDEKVLYWRDQGWALEAFEQ